MDIGLATSAALPLLDDDSRLLLYALQKRNIDAQPLIWDDPAVDWGDMEMCLVRSTWDYTPRKDQFLAWAQQVAEVTQLWNPFEVIRWNTDKVYLQDLEARGVRIVPTRWVAAGEPFDLAAVMASNQWEQAVIKPTVSANGNDTHWVTPENMADVQAQMALLAQTRSLMIQPFIQSITTVGEYSFVFVDGAFTHAVVKKPQSGQFKVHEHLGGTTRRYQPMAEEIAFAESVLDAAGFETLYGRVDMVVDDKNRLCVSELEVVEPSLYLVHAPETADILADVLQMRLQTDAILG